MHVFNEAERSTGVKYCSGVLWMQHFIYIVTWVQHPALLNVFSDARLFFPHSNTQLTG